VSVTAVIISPMDGSLGDSGAEDPHHLAGFTVEQLSSENSTATGGDTKIVHTAWSCSADSWTDTGRHVQHRPDTAGNHVITCTVTGDGGGTNSTTKTITSVTPTFTFDKYVKAAGAGGSDGASGADDANAYATIEKAFQKWRDLGSGPERQGVYGIIRIKDTAPPAFTGLADASHDPSPDHGFLIITRYGTSVVPEVLCNDNTNITCNPASHVPEEWGWSVYFKDVKFTWAGRNENNSIALGNPGSQFDNCTMTKGYIPLQSNRKRAFIGGGITQSGKDGCFASASWLILDGTTVNLNCLAGVNAEHQVYGSAGLNHWAYRRLTIVGDDQGNDGLRSVSARIGYVADCAVSSIFNAGDAYFPGANNIGDRHSSQYMAERVTASSMNSGFNFNSTDDGLVRNFILKAGTGTWAARMASLNASDRADNVRLYHGVFYGNTSRDVLTDSVATNLVLKNSIVMRTDGAALLEIGDASKITCDYNCYWRVGGTPENDATFAIVGGVTKTWAQWKALGQDLHSKFVDPLFTNAAGGDFTLQATSPCIAAAPRLGEVPFDFVGSARSATTTMGAYETTSAPPGIPPVPPCGDRLESFKPAMKEVYAWGGTMRRGGFN